VLTFLQLHQTVLVLSEGINSFLILLLPVMYLKRKIKEHSMSLAGGKATPWIAVALWVQHWGFSSGIFGFVGFLKIILQFCLVSH